MNKLKEYKEFFNVDRDEYLKNLERRIEKLERQLELAHEERDGWRERCKKLVIENIGLQK